VSGGKAPTEAQVRGMLHAAEHAIEYSVESLELMLSRQIRELAKSWLAQRDVVAAARRAWDELEPLLLAALDDDGNCMANEPQDASCPRCKARAAVVSGTPPEGET